MWNNRFLRSFSLGVFSAIIWLALSACSSSPKGPRAIKQEVNSNNSIFAFEEQIFIGDNSLSEEAINRELGVQASIQLATYDGVKKANSADSVQVDSNSKVKQYSFLFKDELSKPQVEKINELISALGKDAKIFVHSSGGQLAAAWLAIHLALFHNYRPSQALIVADSAGLSDRKIRQRAESFIYLYQKR